MTSEKETNIVLTGSVNMNKFKIFEIKEIKNSTDNSFSDFILLMTKNRYTIFDDGRIIKDIKDYHITIHECPGKESVMIKSTQIDKDGNEFTLAQVNPGIKRDHLFIPLFYSIIGKDKQKKYTESTIKEIFIGRDYNPNVVQMHYLVALSDNTMIPAYLNKTKSQIVHLGKYNLHILFLYSSIISKNYSVFRFKTTKREEYEFLSGKTPDEIEQYLFSLFIDSYEKIKKYG